MENVLAELDKGKYGLTFSSGLGATTIIFGLLNSGDNIIVGDDIYGGTNRLFNKVGTKFGLQITLTDLTDLTNLEKAIKPNTKVNKVCVCFNEIVTIVNIVDCLGGDSNKPYDESCRYKGRGRNYKKT